MGIHGEIVQGSVKVTSPIRIFGNQAMQWKFGNREYDLAKKSLVLGIVNVTPDSFSDGGKFNDPAHAIAHGEKLVSEGADLLDIGGESSRPGAATVSLEEELNRVVPVVRELAKRVKVPISVDTTKAEVARACLTEGAEIINDITGLRGDPAMTSVAATSRCGVIVMHMQGTPETMQISPQYDDVVNDVDTFFAERIKTLGIQGILENAICLDPGIGFGKTTAHNLRLIQNLRAFHHHGRPICLGVSRKGFFGSTLGRKLTDRVMASLSIACFAIAEYSAHLFRVHDVEPTSDAIRLWHALSRS